MDAKDTIRKIVADSGMSMAAISRALGYNENYINSRVVRKNIPRVDTLALVGDICGFDLLLRQRETQEETLIDPPEHDNN